MSSRSEPAAHPGDARPYLAWRTIWRSLLLDPGPRPPTPADVEAVVADGSEDDRAPLLGAVLGIPMPDNAFTASLTPAQRADATRVVLLECLRRCCASGPVTVVIDDAHWLDELSQGLLEHLAANVGDLPVLLVVAAREEPRVADLLTRLRALAHCTSVSLPGLAPEEAERLVSARAGSGSRGEALPPDLVRRIALRGGGNPLFLEQLVTWARDQPGGHDDGPVGRASRRTSGAWCWPGSTAWSPGGRPRSRRPASSRTPSRQRPCTPAWRRAPGSRSSGT